MRGQVGFFDIDERLKQLSAKGDSLERLQAVIDFELFRASLARAGGAALGPHLLAKPNAGILYATLAKGPRACGDVLT